MEVRRPACSPRPGYIDLTFLIPHGVFRLGRLASPECRAVTLHEGAMMHHELKCTLAEGFSFREKVWAQLSFLVMGISGTVGILLADWPWVFPYVLIYWYGIPGVVMRHLNCPRCPHLHVYGDCLQAPVSLTRWLAGSRKTTPFSRLEKSLFYGIFLLIPTYPIYWLLSHEGLLAVFLIAAGAWYAGQFLRFCKRCRVYGCPFNRVSLIQQQ